MLPNSSVSGVSRIMSVTSGHVHVVATSLSNVASSPGQVWFLLLSLAEPDLVAQKSWRQCKCYPFL